MAWRLFMSFLVVSRGFGAIRRREARWSRCLSAVLAAVFLLVLWAPLPAWASPGDADDDGVPDGFDNCASVYNPDQLNGDKGSECPDMGDACDPDDDNDGILDAADPDDDNDGIPDVMDPCPTVPSGLSIDADMDGID